MLLRCTVEAVILGKKTKSKGSDQGLQLLPNGLKLLGVCGNRQFACREIQSARIFDGTTSGNAKSSGCALVLRVKDSRGMDITLTATGSDPFSVQQFATQLSQTCKVAVQGLRGGATSSGAASIMPGGAPGGMSLQQRVGARTNAGLERRAAPDQRGVGGASRAPPQSSAGSSSGAAASSSAFSKVRPPILGGHISRAGAGTMQPSSTAGRPGIDRLPLWRQIELQEARRIAHEEGRELPEDVAVREAAERAQEAAKEAAKRPKYDFFETLPEEVVDALIDFLVGTPNLQLRLCCNKVKLSSCKRCMIHAKFMGEISQSSDI